MSERPAADLVVSGISKRYGAHLAVDNVSFGVAPGSFLTMLGPSGSGKTTILKVIAGFEPFDQGSISVSGQEIKGLAPYKRDVGFVFQQYALFPHLTVRDNIGYPLRMRGAGSSAIASAVAEAAGLMKLDGLLDRKPSMLSGGQQQRVALARAIVFRPPVLLMDEPMAALDRRLREEMQIEIRNLQRRLGITTIAVTHDQTEALVMSDQILVLSAGRVEQVGTPSEVYHAPKSLFVAQFLGESNVIDGRAGGDAARPSVTLAAPLSPLLARSAADVTPGMPVHYVVRPECIAWVRGEEADCTTSGVVKDVVFAGDILRLAVETPYGLLSVKRLFRLSDRAPDTGARIDLWWRSEDAVLVPKKGNGSR